MTKVMTGMFWSCTCVLSSGKSSCSTDSKGWKENEGRIGREERADESGDYKKALGRFYGCVCPCMLSHRRLCSGLDAVSSPTDAQPGDQGSAMSFCPWSFGDVSGFAPHFLYVSSSSLSPNLYIFSFPRSLFLGLLRSVDRSSSSPTLSSSQPSTLSVRSPQPAGRNARLSVPGQGRGVQCENPWSSSKNPLLPSRTLRPTVTASHFVLWRFPPRSFPSPQCHG